jgi:hypothetical protein
LLLREQRPTSRCQQLIKHSPFHSGSRLPTP